MRKKLFCCLIAAIITMAGALSLGNAAPIAGNTVSIETVDNYLRENGFSEEFILQTGEQTKRTLYEEGGVFDSDSELNVSHDGIRTRLGGFYCDINCFTPLL